MKQRCVKSVLVALSFLLFFLGQVRAQNVVQFEIADFPEEVESGELFDVAIRAAIEPGWHLYSMDLPEGGPIPTSLEVEENEAFGPGGPAVEPPPTPWFDQNFNMQTNYHEGSVDFQVPVRVKSSAPAGEQRLSVKVRFMACDDSSCLPPQTRTLAITLPVVASGGSATLSGPSVSAEEAEVAGEAGKREMTAGESEEAGEAVATPAPMEEALSDDGNGGLPGETLAYIWFAMTMGGLALLTPCVFPMIPITVSYFTKRDAQTRGRAAFEAGLYSIGIIATFTFLGFALTFLFGAGGINKLAASPIVNLLIALVFVVFALSLFGVIELRLPNSWLNAVNRKSTATGGISGILLMALTFSLTSFTCTVPFVGTVMVAALQGDLLWSLLGVTAFAFVFSLPFFLLALFPSWLQSLPKSGNWMNSVKITMGFLELAAALKFISNVDLVYQWELITRPVFITVWLAIGLVTAGYLLGWFRFAHESPSETVGAFRVLFAIAFVAISLYLFRGLFGFSLGEIDAFLPPRDYGAVASISASLGGGDNPGHEEVWLSDYEEGLQVARAENRPVFLDFTGYTCTNCRWMEANMFPHAEVAPLMKEYVLVRLYTDGAEPEHEANRRFEEERFKTIALPFYALMTPEDEVIATFPGLTRDHREFVAFLKKGLTDWPDESRVSELQAGVAE